MDKDEQQTPQPQSEFLARMDLAENPNPAPEKPKKKLSKGMIIGITVGAVALIGAVVAVIIIMNSSGSNSQTTSTVSTTTYPDDEEDELPEDVVERNELRKNDLNRLVTATVDYQSNSKGAIPGDEVEQWEWLVKNYIPDGLKDSATGEEYTIKAVCKFSESCIDIDELNWEDNQHEIYIYLNAACKGDTKEDVIVSHTGKRKAAMFAILEGSQTFLCVSN